MFGISRAKELCNDAMEIDTQIDSHSCQSEDTFPVDGTTVAFHCSGPGSGIDVQRGKIYQAVGSGTLGSRSGDRD